MPLKKLLLDLDGTLADSMPLLRHVYWRFVEEVGGFPTEGEFRELNGPPLAEVVRRICAAHNVAGYPHHHLSRYENLIDASFEDIAPAAGAEDLLLHARCLGISSHLVTSNTARRAKAWLTASGLDPLCTLVVAGDEVKEGKPSPEPYRRALERLGMNSHEVIAVEDSLSGAQSALAAGIRTLKLGVVDEVPSHPLLEPIAALRDAKPIISRLAGANG